jgi:hypothetical protein
MRKIICLLLVFPLAVFGQKTGDIITLSLGWASANIGFKEAIDPSINFFGRIFNTGNTFVGEGPEFGISKNISKNMFAEISFSTFTGKETKAKVNNNENYYTLAGFQLPLTLNYLTGDNNKRLRINLGGGGQLLKSHLQQFETIINNSGQTTTRISDINISEFQLALVPGVQFRIIGNLFTSFLVKVGISTNGRYADYPCFSIKYTFRTKH